MSTETPASGLGDFHDDASQHVPAAASPAGWYADPNDESLLRWWNGDAWTDAVRPPDDEAGTAVSAPKSNTRKRAVIGGTAAVAVIGLMAIFGASAMGSQTVMVDFTIDVDKGCYDTSFGYGDFDDGTVVTVESGSGEVLGVGRLEGSPNGYSNCEYTAQFEVDESEDGIYVVSAGYASRGEKTYDESDIEDGVLTVDLYLG